MIYYLSYLKLGGHVFVRIIKASYSMKAGYRILFTKQVIGFLGGTNGKESICQCREPQEIWVQFLGWGDPLK